MSDAQPQVSHTGKSPLDTAIDVTQVPFNLEAEQGLLGAMLIQNDVLDDVADFLTSQHFYDPLHQRVYQHMTRLISNGNLASVVTLKTAMAQDEGLAQLGGDKYLASLYANASTLSHAKNYGQLIYDLAIRRALITLGHSIVHAARNTEDDATPHQQIETAEQKLYKLAERGVMQQGFTDFEQSLTATNTLITNAFKRKTRLTGLSTGFKDLDRVLGGLQQSDLLIIAARPGMGKTALATNIAYHVAKKHVSALADADAASKDPGAVVGFFSLEMAAEQLATRILAQDIGVPASKIRTGELNNAEYERLIAHMQALHNLPLFIDPTGAISLPSLMARARRLKRQQNLGLLVIDYLQLVRASTRRTENRVQEISEITQGLKALAKELNIPVLALSQLSRQVEGRDNKRPQLSDLRESGAIEQDADVVMFIYREAYYLKHNEPMAGTPEHISWQEKMQKCEGKADLIIGKNRHGPAPKIDLQFTDKLTRFRDYDAVHDQDAYLAQPRRAPKPDDPNPYDNSDIDED